MRDRCIGTCGKLGKLGFGLSCHDAMADHDSADYGSEINAVATYAVTKYLPLIAK